MRKLLFLISTLFIVYSCNTAKKLAKEERPTKESETSMMFAEVLQVGKTEQDAKSPCDEYPCRFKVAINTVVFPSSLDIKDLSNDTTYLDFEYAFDLLKDEDKADIKIPSKGDALTIEALPKIKKDTLSWKVYRYQVMQAYQVTPE